MCESATYVNKQLVYIIRSLIIHTLTDYLKIHKLYVFNNYVNNELG